MQTLQHSSTVVCVAMFRLPATQVSYSDQRPIDTRSQRSRSQDFRCRALSWRRQGNCFILRKNGRVFHCRVVECCLMHLLLILLFSLFLMRV